MDIGINLGTILIALIASVIAPGLMAYMSASARRTEKDQDYAREDKLAAQAREDAKAMIESNNRIAESTKVLNGKVDVIHTLVNSNMTAAMQSEYDSMTRELASFSELIEIKRTQGNAPTAETIRILGATEAKLRDLRAALDDRHIQQKIVDMQEKNIKDMIARDTPPIQKDDQKKEVPEDKAAGGPTVEAPVRVIVPGSDEKANSTVEKK